MKYIVKFIPFYSKQFQCHLGLCKFAVLHVQTGLAVLHNVVQDPFPVLKKRIILSILYRVYQKKGNRTLQCSVAFIIQSTEIIIPQAERPGFSLSIVIIFVKFEERLGKYESNENSRSKSHIFTSEHY